MAKYDYFISYCREDINIAEKIVTRLEERGASVWIDLIGIESGEQFKRKIVSAIQNSDCVIFLSSQSSNRSPWVAKEIGVAVYEHKRIIPIRLDDSKYNEDIIFDLINLDYIEVEETNSDNSIDYILGRITGSIPKPKPEPKSKSKQSIKEFIINNAKNRDSSVNVFLYLIFISSIISSLYFVAATFKALSSLFSPTWTFGEIYGKGWMVGLIISLSTMWSSWELINWKRNGMCILIITLTIALIPLMWNEYLELIWFSIPSFFGILLLYSSLLTKKSGQSAWDLCKKASKPYKAIAIAALSIWLFLVTIFPIIMSYAGGFRSNLYKNGIICIDAKLNNSPFYSLRLYRELLLGDNKMEDDFNRYNNATIWLEHAKWLIHANEDDSIVKQGWVDDTSEERLLLDNVVYHLKYDGEEATKKWLHSQNQEVIGKCRLLIKRDTGIFNEEYYTNYKYQVIQLLESEY